MEKLNESGAHVRVNRDWGFPKLGVPFWVLIWYFGAYIGVWSYGNIHLQHSLATVATACLRSISPKKLRVGPQGHST